MNQLGPIETKKRKREFVTSITLGLVFLLFTWIQFQLFNISHKLPFVHSIFFFGLVNLNIILLLFLSFLIFRNVVKIFVEREGRFIGSSLKGKLVAAFAAFSFVPTVLMFTVSVFYINSSFDKWFSVKTTSLLKDALEVNNLYHLFAKRKNYHFAEKIVLDLKGVDLGNVKLVEKKVAELRDLYALDVVEYYPNVFDERVVSVTKGENLPEIPRVSLEFLEKGLNQRIEASTIHHFGGGNLVRVIVPFSKNNPERGVLVVSTYIPLSLVSKVDDIAAAYEDFRENPLKYPVKSIYLIVLILMTLVILLAATWFGFHLAKELSVPLVSLGRAAKKVASGTYQSVDVVSGSVEINQLIDSFNTMVTNLETSEKEVQSANKTLRATLEQLDEHNRYIEVILSNVSAGVVSVDPEGKITTINRHAGKLLKLEPTKYIGRPAADILTEEYKEIFDGLIRTLRKHKAQSIKKEIRLSIQNEPMVIQVTITLLKDDKGSDLGMVLVFDDLTVLANAQRASAWREVARRIAHEIKNPLTPIQLSAQRLQKKFSETVNDPAFEACTTTIIQQVEAMKKLVNEFHNFARLPQAKPIPSEMNKVIQESLVLYQEGHRDVKFETHLDESLPKFDFDPEQIKRVLTNLVENAVAALEGQSVKNVSLTTQFDNMLKIVKVTITDTGCGISEKNRQHIFEPYFSTKEHGTGLGLAIVKKIVEDHSGFIRAYPNEPNGTRIVFELPVLHSTASGLINTEEV